MRYYLNTHMALEQRRMQNQQSGHPGPRVLVTGPSGSGRTSLCRILLNYAVRIERTPLFVDLNPREGNLAVPGTLGAAVIEEMLPPELPFVLANPHVLHFGHAGPEDDRYVYDHQVASLARIVSSKMESDPLVQASGMFINCPALAGADVLATRAAFGCDVVIVLDNERLVNELNALVRQSQSPVEIIGLPKSGGVVVRDESMSKGQDHAAFYKYFYGNPKSETYNLSPFSFDVKLGKVQVFRLGGLQLPASLLPVDADVNEYRLRVSEAPASAGWKHRICSVVEEADIGSSVLGCVCILHYDEERQVIKAYKVMRVERRQARLSPFASLPLCLSPVRAWVPEAPIVA
ncbi:uncharacterized protein MONBRDRAFT_32061 [Monosiga brevicollis MX1]|uniref:Protein CLP1 homolog n=1 Tax=Monosiga brevicollis TaxID=81824 RepID=A9UX46_MONBE|nr:uncharacterized protein MONBRDRAFT_32061 [Monosiga brevicollis MX1]EDQ90152.1 predicted protein [Monosiga brevicollis MX1]|eukprot:XP_001744919.1 hypothetical protein [Monosiga brevicollis MX1]